MSKVNVDRMRKHNRALMPQGGPVVGVQGPEFAYPKGSTVIRDAAGQVVRVLPPVEGGHGA